MIITYMLLYIIVFAFIFTIIYNRSIRRSRKYSKYNKGFKNKSIPIGKEVGTISKTNKGEIVKSKGEKQIADYLYKIGVQYRYEETLYVKGNFYEKKLSKPDFYLPKYNAYIEYWGLVENYKYNKTMRFKMSTYYKNNVKFISLYPDNLKNLDYIFKFKFQKVMGYKLY